MAGKKLLGRSARSFCWIAAIAALTVLAGASDAYAQRGQWAQRADRPLARRPMVQQERPCGPDSIPPALKVLFWQGSGGADFRPACREHDRCYTKGSGRLKANCDCELLHNLNSACQNSRNPRRCRQRARIMYWLTDNFGDSAFGT